MKMTGIMARSASFSAVNCEASLVKIRHGVKRMTFRLARNFCDSASKEPCLATIYPGRLTQTTSNTASKTSRMR